MARRRRRRPGWWPTGWRWPPWGGGRNPPSSPPPPPPPPPPPASNLIRVPVTVYPLAFEAAPEMDATPGGITAHWVVAEVRWSQAEIVWIWDERPRMTVPIAVFPALRGNESRDELRQRFAAIAGFLGLPGDQIAVVVMRSMAGSPGGVWSGRHKAIMYAETSPEGVLAHELGHALGLPHHDAPDNLMQAGGGNIATATKLTEEQIAQAREAARG